MKYYDGNGKFLFEAEPSEPVQMLLDAAKNIGTTQEWERDAYQVAADYLAMELKVLRDSQKVCTSPGCVQKEAEFIQDPAVIRAAFEQDTEAEGRV